MIYHDVEISSKKYDVQCCKTDNFISKAWQWGLFAMQVDPSFYSHRSKGAGHGNPGQGEQSRWIQVTAIQVMQSLHLLLVLGSLVLFPAPSKSMAAHDQDRRSPGQFANHILAKREARQCPTGCCKSCVRSHVDCYIYTRHVEKKPWGPCGIGKFCSWIHDTFCNDTDNVYP